MHQTCLLALVSLGIAALVGCSDGTPPAAYKHTRDQLAAMVPAVALIGFAPCSRGGDEFLPIKDCLNFQPPQRMKGVWVRGPDMSIFYPGLDSFPPWRTHTRLYLVLDDSPERIAELRRIAQRTLTTGVAKIEFIGQRSTVPGDHGIWGGYRHIILVNQFLAAAPIACPAKSDWDGCAQDLERSLPSS